MNGRIFDGAFGQGPELGHVPLYPDAKVRSAAGYGTLESFIKKANRKLLELDIMQSVWELKNGKGEIYKSSIDFMRDIKSKLD